MTQLCAETAIGNYCTWRDQLIYYVQAGPSRSQYPPLLLVHGFGASTDHWRKTIAGLQDEFAIWAIDLLGFGRSAKPNWEYSGDLWRDQLHDFITDVIRQPVVLVGNSLGGYASLCVAAQRPNSACGLVLLNSAGPFSDSEPTQPPSLWQTLRRRTLQTLFQQDWVSYLIFQYTRRRSTIRKTLQKVYLDQSAVTDQLVEDIYRPACDPGAAQVFASIFRTPQGEWVDTLLRDLRHPLLLLWGEGDPWMDVNKRSAQFRQHYPHLENLQEHFLPAGHCPHDELPDQVNQYLRDWIKAI
ncbi:alpha/beta fold hydrolase [Trichothermofontia sichuanensis B231]|uniref:alpha/beta fold hydrolase n=1 Tax=Trichothermofontia sichuanensis TaxID=3045816 RepID=UPI0022480A9F|nr:alpha/beta fold hydrolase [Trichothermofontia sichuanensis]UZQ53407.1 alpha/beta fold hydrolase [Trichothermofontia sichuanensis B231]